jgi:hypothetical protein
MPVSQQLKLLPVSFLYHPHAVRPDTFFSESHKMPLFDHESIQIEPLIVLNR